MSIINLLNQVKNGEIVLPAIQRDFVWKEEQIEMLLDSIMRGYPVGIALLWETYHAIQYRRFEQDYKPGTRHVFHDNAKQQRVKVVLDGQQRLQSMFVALYGSYDGKQLWFDVLSGEEVDDYREQKYDFQFYTPKQAEDWNQHTREQLKLPPAKREPDFYVWHYVRVRDLFSMGVKERQQFRKKLSKELQLTELQELRVETNLARFDEVMTRDSNILKESVIDQNKPSESPERKSEADVLEIFVRINRQGTPLSRSDLVFSMLKLNWKESAEALPDFVERVNEGNAFEIDNDFVIRCLFAVSDLGTKFDLELLRVKSNVERMQQRFQACCNAIASVIDFATNHCWCQSSRVLGGSITLVPFVYYFAHLPKHEVPNREVERVRKALFLLAFAQPFNRYADSRLARFIKDELKPQASRGAGEFPLVRTADWVRHWENVQDFGEGLLRRNVSLTLHLVQGLSGAKVLYSNNAPEVDHIFPRAQLREKGFEPSEIEHFANYWILSKGKNRNKSDKHPAKYLADVAAEDLARALIDPDLLDYRRYTTFLEKRGQAMVEAVRKRTGFTPADFERPQR